MRAWDRPLELLEAAYRLDGSDGEWMEHLVQVAHGVFAGEQTGAAGVVVLGGVDDCGRTVVRGFENVRTRGHGVVHPVGPFMQALASLPPRVQERLVFSYSTADTCSHKSGLGTQLLTDRYWRTQSGWDPDVAKDAFELLCHDSSERALVLGIPLRAISTITEAERRLGERLAAHIGAALRLRTSNRCCADTADAVLSVDGRLEHLTLAVDADPIREGFERRAHAKKAGCRPEDALAVWRGLHDGRWSLVDYVDTDGKAFVLAVENLPRADVQDLLTDRQRAVLALAALGYGNKQIAYALGVSQPAVAMSLRRARQASGYRTRAELVRAFKRRRAQ